MCVGGERSANNSKFLTWLGGSEVFSGKKMIKREGLEANNDDYWTQMRKCTKNRSEI